MLVNAIFQFQEQYKLSYNHNNSTTTNKNIISEWYTHFLSVCARFSLLGGTVSVADGTWSSEPAGVGTALPVSSVWPSCLDTQRGNSLEIQTQRSQAACFIHHYQEGVLLNSHELRTQIIQRLGLLLVAWIEVPITNRAQYHFSKYLSFGRRKQAKTWISRTQIIVITTDSLDRSVLRQLRLHLYLRVPGDHSRGRDVFDREMGYKNLYPCYLPSLPSQPL